LKTYKVLLVDDDVDLVELNRGFLEKNSCDVVFAFNGPDGIEKAKRENPDIIVLDVMMNEVGEGFEVARQLRAEEDTKNIPILMLSSVNNEHGFNLTIGPDDAWNPVDFFIDKPFSPQDLLKKINEMLQ
jgi:two-component system, OmpR family, alkaline phosphatase synthesis response regulator PhoP